MKNKFKFKIFLGSMVIGFVLFNNNFFSKTSVLEFDDLVVRLRSKEICSCIFIQEASEDICIQKVKYFLPTSGIKIDKNKEVVEVEFLGEKMSAKFKNIKEGCSFI